MKLRHIMMMTPLLAAAMVETRTAQATPLDTACLKKYVDPLPRPAKVIAQSPNNAFMVTISEFEQKLHRDLPATTVWGYDGSYPGPTIEATRGVPVSVTFENDLFAPTLLNRLPVDQTLSWADPLGFGRTTDPYFGPVPVVPHLHGGETQSANDGHPNAWFTPLFEFRGSTWSKFSNDYDNTQEAATLWYHDHALGMTRLNVWGGLAGFYILRDPDNEPQNLPSGDFEREIVIQDRLFDDDGQLRYVTDVQNPLPPPHPFWAPEAFGDTIVVNGKIWPFLEVEPRKYRFRLLNGSNARFYNLRLDSGQSFTQIGIEGGYLNAPVSVKEILLAPAERADVVVDFSHLHVGAKVTLRNDARAPFPAGALPDHDTTAQIMQFHVVPLTTPDTSSVPANLRPNNPIVPLTQAPVVQTRTLTLNEVAGPGGPTGLFLDGKTFEAPATENPLEGTTEIWEIVNLTADTHPIHLHLVHFQVLNRQPFKTLAYTSLYNAVNPIIPVPPGTPYLTVPVTTFLAGAAKPPAPNEQGWKDTVRMNPGDITRLLVRFAPQDTPASDTQGQFPFDPSTGPGYVWHCHIIEHEDNEMMRPLRVRPAP